jgi:hypothetical protein
LACSPSWRWIFIIEGLATVVMAFACYFFLPDSPGLAAGKWLTHDEARFLQLTHIYTRGMQKKPEIDESTGKAKFQWSVVWQVLTDWQLYLQALVFMSNAVPNYGLVSSFAAHISSLLTIVRNLQCRR